LANNAIQLGSGKYGKVSTYSALDGLTSYTVEGWFYLDSGATGRQATYMMGNGTGTDYRSYIEQGETGGITGVNFGHRYSSTSADGNKLTGLFDTNTWTHIAMVAVQTARTKIYKNGTEITYNIQNTPSGTYSNTNSCDVYHGAWLAGFSKGNFPGRVGCFRMWNVARSGTELADNKDYYLDPTEEIGLILNVNYDEETGTSSDNDVSGGNDMVFTGSPSWVGGPTLTAKSYGGMTGISVWNGSAFVEKPVKVWSGSAWVQKPVKRWNGSSWV